MWQCWRCQRATWMVLQTERWSLYTSPVVEWRHLVHSLMSRHSSSQGYIMSDSGLWLASWWPNPHSMARGRCLAWDATVVDTLATLYLSANSTGGGSAAEAAVKWKEVKCSALSSSHIFIPVAIKALGPVNEVCESFLAHVSKLLLTKSYANRESFLFQESQSSFSALMK